MAPMVRIMTPTRGKAHRVTADAVLTECGWPTQTMTEADPRDRVELCVKCWGPDFQPRKP